MKIVTIKEMKIRVRKIIDKYPRMTGLVRAELTSLGFHQEELGHGKSNYILSQQIKIKNWEGKRVLAVGISSIHRGFYQRGGFTVYRAMVLEINKKPGRDKMNNIFKDYKGQVIITFNHDKRWIKGYIKYYDNIFMRVDVTEQSYERMEYNPAKPVIIPIYSIKVIVLAKDKLEEEVK